MEFRINANVMLFIDIKPFCEIIFINNKRPYSGSQLYIETKNIQ